jgi:hypothetical protein
VKAETLEEEEALEEAALEDVLEEAALELAPPFWQATRRAKRERALVARTKTFFMMNKFPSERWFYFTIAVDIKNTK